MVNGDSSSGQTFFGVELLRKRDQSSFWGNGNTVDATTDATEVAPLFNEPHNLYLLRFNRGPQHSKHVSYTVTGTLEHYL